MPIEINSLDDVQTAFVNGKITMGQQFKFANVYGLKFILQAEKHNVDLRRAYMSVLNINTEEETKQWKHYFYAMEDGVSDPRMPNRIIDMALAGFIVMEGGYNA